MKNNIVAIDAYGFFNPNPRGHIKCVISTYQSILAKEKDTTFLFYTYPAPKNIEDIFPGATNAKKITLDPRGSSFFDYMKIWKNVSLPFDIFNKKAKLLHSTCNRIPYFLNCSIISNIYDIIPLYYAENELYQKIFKHYKNVLEKSNLIITCSDFSKNELIRLYGEKYSDKIKTIYLAIPNDKIDLSENEQERIKEKFQLNKFILSLGHETNPRKNIDTVIECFKEFSKNRSNEYKLVIPGISNPESIKYFQTLAKNLNIQNKLVLPGYVSEKDLVYLYQEADFFLYLSLYEGFGLPPLEAMRCDCPVIASNTTSIPEIVDDAALLVDPSNKSEIVQAMIEVDKNTKLQNDLIHKGNKQVLKYSWSRTADEILSLFNAF